MEKKNYKLADTNTYLTGPCSLFDPKKSQFSREKQKVVMWFTYNWPLVSYLTKILNTVLQNWKWNLPF